MLIRPTALDVINEFHGYLDATGRHRTTSRELADAKGWSLMEVSAALNQASQHGTMIKEGATFRPAVSQIGRPIATRQSAPAEPEPTPSGGLWPPDAQFAERYERALESPLGVTVGLQAEFGRPYFTISSHASNVYQRLGFPKPSARGRKPLKQVLGAGRSNEIQWPEDAEFVERYEAALKATSDVRGAVAKAFGLSYTTVRRHAKLVYYRLGKPKPSARNWKTIPEQLTPQEVTEVAERLGKFWSEFEPQQPVESPIAPEHADVPEQVSVASSKAQGATTNLATDEAGGSGLTDAEAITHLKLVVKGLTSTAQLLRGNNARLHAELRQQDATIEAKEAENADLWAKLRQADADLTERDKLIESLKGDIAMLADMYNEGEKQIERLTERLATTHRTIESLNARLAQAETRPQQITLTLTLPMDALHVSR